MTGLEDLGSDLKAELEDRITPRASTLESVVRVARRRARIRKLVAATTTVALVAAVSAVVVRAGSHRSDRVTAVATGPRATSTASTEPPERLTGDTWVLDILRRSRTSWTTISGVVELQGANAPLRFAVSRTGPWYWELGSEFSGVYEGLVVNLDGTRHTVGVTPAVAGGPSNRPTNTDTVNELVAPVALLDASVEVNASSVHVVGTETVAGRRAWRTEIRFPSGSALGPTWTWWIDQQTGIVLRSTIRGSTKGFTSVEIDQPLPTFPNPTVPKGYSVDALVARRPFHEVVASDEPLTTLLAQLRARTTP